MAGRPTNEPDNYFAIGLQSAKGTEASTFTFLRHLDGTALELNEDTESVREGGDGQEVGLRYKTAISLDGNAVINSRPEAAARLNAWVFGADITSAGDGIGSTASGVAHQHLAVPTSSQPYVTAEQYWADKVERGVDMKMQSVTLEWEQGRPLKLTYELMGGGSMYAGTGPQTPTRETGQPFFYPGASVTLDGAANSKVTKGKITFKRTLDGDIRTNALSREDVVGLNIDTDLELTLKHESATSIYDKAHYGAAGGTQVPIDLATGAIKIYTQFGSGTNVRYQEWGVNQFHYTGARVNKLDPDGKTMYIDVAGMGYKAATYQAYCRTFCASAAAFV
jgi:hypothetical protein